mgnify:CR=1 FL=1
MKELLEEVMDRFNEKAQKDPKLQEALEGKVRKVYIHITDGTSYNFTLRDKRVGGLSEGPIGDPDITVTSTEEVMTKILRKEMKPLKAYITKKVSFDASLEDLLTLKQFF